MENMYAIKTTTLTALGDAIRSKYVKYIFNDIPNEPFCVVNFNSNDYQISEWTYVEAIPPYRNYYITFDFADLLGDKIDYLPTRRKYEITFNYQSNLSECNEIYMSFDGWTTGLMSMSSTDIERHTVKTIYPTTTTNKPTLAINVDDSKIEGLEFNFNLEIRAIDDDENYINLNKFTPLEMAVKINELSAIPEEAFTITGSCNYKFANGGWDWFIEQCEDKITTSDISSMANMFYATKLEKIPFELNGNTSVVEMSNCFQNTSLKSIPRLNIPKVGGFSNVFAGCRYVREIIDDSINIGEYQGHTSTSTSHTNIFDNCSSLRKISPKLLSNIWNKADGYYYSCYYNMVNGCYVLDELKNIPVAPGKYTSNAFGTTFNTCNRLKELTFETNEDGTAKIAPWKSQTISLNTIGYGGTKSNILNYNSGITADKEVKDDATYATLKDDPDWFTFSVNYSRYNRNSAVNTINSLPDCSATGTNTIKFMGAAGALTDGGAINTLTAEEIAVAAAKGWSVSLV